MKTARLLAFAGGLLGLLPWLPATAQPAEQDKLFLRLDRDGNGYLDQNEMQAAVASRSSWIAIDRDQDERVSRDEFQSMTHAEVQPRLRGYSAQRLIGTEVRYRNGAALGEVHDILVNPRGKVDALLVETRGPGVQHVRVPWGEAQVAAGAAHIDVPADLPLSSASAGATRAVTELRMSEMLHDPVELAGGARYGRVNDLVIGRGGDVDLVVVDPDAPEARGLYAYPWQAGRYDYRRGVHTLPYVRAPRMEPFDYSALGFAGPR